MTRNQDRPGPPPPPQRRGAAPGESIIRDGLRGIALVTLATAGLGALAAVVTLLVSLLYR